MDRETMTEREFCEKVGISLMTAWRLRNAGALPHYKIGKKILYSKDHLAAFLKSSERSATKASA